MLKSAKPPASAGGAVTKLTIDPRHELSHDSVPSQGAIHTHSFAGTVAGILIVFGVIIVVMAMLVYAWPSWSHGL